MRHLRPSEPWPRRHPFITLALLCLMADVLVDGTTASGFSREAPVVFALLCAGGIGLFMGTSRLERPRKLLTVGAGGCSAVLFGGICAVSHGAVAVLLATALVLLLLLLGGLWAARRLNVQRTVALLLCMGFCLRLAYVVYTSVTTRQHDVWFFGGDRGHAGYIEYFYNGGSLWFDFDPRTRWQFYHPPLHHLTAAVWMRLHTLLGFSYGRACESVQILTLFYSCGSTLCLIGIFRELRLRGWGLVLPTAVAAFHPAFILFSGSINNDVLAAFLQFAAVLWALRWYRQPGMGNILRVALCVGGSMAAKLSGALCAPAIALVFLYRWWKDRRHIRAYFAQFAAFALVCVPLGLGWSVLNLVRWGVPVGYVPVLGTADNAQYVGDHPLWQRLFGFAEEQGSVYMAWDSKNGTGYYEYNLWLGLWKTSVFGEFTLFSPSSPGLTAGEQLCHRVGLGLSCVLYVVNLLCMGLSLAAGVRTLRRGCGFTGGVLPTAAVWVLFACTVLSYISMCLGAPHTCTQNFRYTTPLLLCGTVWLGRWAQDLQARRRYAVAACLAVPVGVFCAAAAGVYTLLGAVS